MWKCGVDAKRLRMWCLRSILGVINFTKAGWKRECINRSLLTLMEWSRAMLIWVGQSWYKNLADEGHRLVSVLTRRPVTSPHQDTRLSSSTIPATSIFSSCTTKHSPQSMFQSKADWLELTLYQNRTRRFIKKENRDRYPRKAIGRQGHQPQG